VTSEVARLRRVGSRVETGGLEFVTHRFKRRAQRWIIAVLANQSIDVEHPKSYRFEVKRGDRTPKGIGLFRQARR